MHPAFSVILFTTLSGAGYGLFVWLGLLLAGSRLLGSQPGEIARHGIASGLFTAASPTLAVVALATGLLLTAVGLLSSTFHLGKPLRAWRAFSQWRTSWLSREGVLAVLAFAPALALAGLLWGADASLPGAGTVVLLALALVAVALLTVACTAMIYASLKPIPAWRHALVVPVYVLFALLTGLALAAALLVLGAADLPVPARRGLAGLLVLLAVAVAAVKARYWRDLDRTPLTLTRGDAVGLPGRSVGVFERPHTDDNYLTREMGFVLARKHARSLRAIALLLFGALPALLGWLVLAAPGTAALAFPLAALAALVGAMVERWLFFAQARHLVTLYY